MATVEVSFTPLPAHVRTARLVATAVARHSGVAESLLDEVRLAVGEACSRAVEAHQRHCPSEPVRIALTDQPGRFEIQVTDITPARADGTEPGADAAAAAQAGRPDPALMAGAAGTTADAAGPASGAAEQGAAGPAAWDGIGSPHGFALAVIAGLADAVQVTETAAGTSITMSWPCATAARELR